MNIQRFIGWLCLVTSPVWVLMPAFALFDVGTFSDAQADSGKDQLHRYGNVVKWTWDGEYNQPNEEWASKACGARGVASSVPLTSDGDTTSVIIFCNPRRKRSNESSTDRPRTSGRE